MQQTEKIRNLIHAVRIQLEDFTDDQLEELVNILIFEQRDRDKDLEDLKDLDKEFGSNGLDDDK